MQVKHLFKKHCVSIMLGQNLSKVQSHNHKLVINIVRRYGPIARTDISRITGLTKQTVTNLVYSLLDNGYLLETGEQSPTGGGRPSRLLELNPESAYSFGFHLDNDHFTGILVNFVGDSLERITFEAQLPTPEQVIEHIDDFISSTSKKFNIPLSKIWGIGLGFPGCFNDKDDTITIDISRLPSWHNVPFVQMLTNNISLDKLVPIYIENDGTSAAIGEFWYNRTRNKLNDFFYTYLDIKIGGGLVLDGKPRFGFTKNAARFLHLNVMSDDGTMTNIPSYVSLTKLYDLLAEANIHIHTPDELLHLYEDENAILMQWLKTSTDYLAQGFTTIESMIDPEMFVFGGRLPVPIYRNLIDQTHKRFLEVRMGSKDYIPAFVLGTTGEYAPAIGASALPFHFEFFEESKIFMT